MNATNQTSDQAPAPSPLCRALQAWMRTDSFGAYNGSCSVVTPAQLLALFRKHGGPAAQEDGFPVNAQRLGMALNKEKEALEAAGIRLLFRRHHHYGRQWIIGTTGDYPDDEALLYDLDEKAQRQRIYGYYPVVVDTFSGFFPNQKRFLGFTRIAHGNSSVALRSASPARDLYV